MAASLLYCDTIEVTFRADDAGKALATAASIVQAAFLKGLDCGIESRDTGFLTWVEQCQLIASEISDERQRVRIAERLNTLTAYLKMMPRT